MDHQGAALANTITPGVTDFEAERAFHRRLDRPLVFDSDDFAVFELPPPRATPGKWRGRQRTILWSSPPRRAAGLRVSDPPRPGP